MSRILFEGQASSLVHVRDLTEKKFAEETQRESDDRQKRFFEAAFEGMVIHEKGFILYANLAFADLLGYALAEVPGITAFDLSGDWSHP